MQKRGTIFIAASFVIALAIFFVLLGNLDPREILEVFYRVRWWHILVLLGLGFLYYLFFNLRWDRILKLEGYEVKMTDLFIYRFAGQAISYLTPAADFGGEPVMAYLLSKDYKEVSFASSFASVVANKLVGLVVNFSFIILSIFYAFFFFVLPEDIEFIFYILLGAVIVLVFLIYFLGLRSKSPLDSVCEKLGFYNFDSIKEKKAKIEEFDALLVNLFHNNPRELAINVGYSLLATLSLVAEVWSLTYFLGFGLSFFDALMAWSIISIVSSVVPAPANLGIAEAGESAWFGILGFGAASGFSFSLILRARELLYSLVGLICLFYKGIWDQISDLMGTSFDKVNFDKIRPKT